MSPPPPRLLVLGLGLLGGSLAREALARGWQVWGYDPDAETRRLAREAGVRPLEDWTAAPWEELRVVVLATPVLTSLRLLPRLAPYLPTHTLLTDVGSTKASLVRMAEASGIADRFVGAHPLAGDHRSGWASSRRGLFQEARIYLSAAPAAHPGARRRAEDFWVEMGGRVCWEEAGEHDRLLAWRSHLPQVLSSALALTLERGGHPAASLGPGGRDSTRLAASSPRLWTDICLDNRPALLSALEALEGELAEFCHALEAGDGGSLERWFAQARAWKEEEKDASP